MREKDFNRLKELQRKKWTEVGVYIDDVGETENAPHGGCQQAITMILGEGIPTTTMMYYFIDPDQCLEAYETPNQKFKIMWVKKDDGGYWKCLPVEAKEMPKDEDFVQVAVDRQTMIVRQSSIRSAVEATKSGLKYKDAKDKTDLIVAMAIKFERYVMGNEK